MKIKAGQVVTPEDILAAAWKSYVKMSDEVFDEEEACFWSMRECGCWRDPCGICEASQLLLKDVRDFYAPTKKQSHQWMLRHLDKVKEPSDLLPNWMNEAIRAMS